MALPLTNIKVRTNGTMIRVIRVIRTIRTTIRVIRVIRVMRVLMGISISVLVRAGV